MNHDIDKLMFIIMKLVKDKRRLVLNADVVSDILKLVKESDLNDKLAFDLLVEVYKYARLASTHITLDPRYDENWKSGTILDIKEAQEKKNLRRIALVI